MNQSTYVVNLKLFKKCTERMSTQRNSDICSYSFSLLKQYANNRRYIPVKIVVIKRKIKTKKYITFHNALFCFDFPVYVVSFTHEEKIIVLLFFYNESLFYNRNVNEEGTRIAN